MKSWLADLFALTGLALIGSGTYWVYPPAAPIVVGAVLLAVGLVGAIRHGNSASASRR